MPKKIITYSTPKQLLPNKEDTRWHNKNKMCKYWKGDHKFDIETIEYLGIGSKKIPFLQQWRCLCGKKGNYNIIDKKFPFGYPMVCSKCGKKLVHAVDSITKKVSKYLYYCPCNPNSIISKG